MWLLLMGGSQPLSAKRVGVYCLMANNGSEVYEDDYVAVRLVLTPDCAALVELVNLTDSILYVDRGRSFAYVNGQSDNLYHPRVQTDSHTYSRGVIDHTWHDVSFYNGESHTSTVTVADERILMVAPHGVALVAEWRDLPFLIRPDMVDVGRRGGHFDLGRNGRFLTPSTDMASAAVMSVYTRMSTKGEKFRKNRQRRYSAQATPLSLGAYIQYSFHEDGTVVRNARVDDYVSQISIGSTGLVDSHGVLKPSAYGRFNKPFFAFRTGTPNALGLTEWTLTAAATIGTLMTIAHIVSEAESMDYPSGWER